MFSKKTLVMLSAIGITLHVVSTYAATTVKPSNANNLTVTIPSLKPGFEFNLTALALKPGASNLNYVIYNKELPIQSPSWTEEELHPEFSPAFALGVRYIFATMPGMDANLTWTHLNNTISSTTVADNVSHFLGPDYEIGPAGIPIRNAYGYSQFRYDVVNLDLGQFVQFGQYVDMRFFGGLSTGFLREDVIASYSGNVLTGDTPGPFSMNQHVKSSFTGIGPRFGMHADVNTDSGIGFLGEAAVSALIGSMYSKTSYLGSSTTLLKKYGQATNTQMIMDKLVYQVVPGIDAKLGVNFKHVFKNSAIFTVSAGYQAAVYINAISQYIPGSLVEGEGLETGGIFVATMSHTLSNYSVQGPFLNFGFQF